MRRAILEALRAKYEAEIAEADATINIYLDHPVAIGEHPQHIDEVNKLGFEKAEGLMIPDDYLKKQNFLVMRTAHGIGDWGILSAMPRLIKEKYPNSKVYVPSKKLLQKLFNLQHDNANHVFFNNPYVDDFVDSIDGEVFHDHYRIYDEENTDVPLIKQMLKFL